MVAIYIVLEDTNTTEQGEAAVSVMSAHRTREGAEAAVLAYEAQARTDGHVLFDSADGDTEADWDRDYTIQEWELEP